MELMETRIKNEDDLKKLLDYPILGVIPEIVVEESETDKVGA